MIKLKLFRKILKNAMKVKKIKYICRQFVSYLISMSYSVKIPFPRKPDCVCRKVAFAMLLTLSIFAIPVRAQKITVSNNLLYDLSGTPNLRVEFPVSEHWSIGVTGGLKPWPRFFFWDREYVQNTTHWRHFLVAPEIRFYPDQVYEKWFLGADLIYTHYNVGNVEFPFGLYPDAKNYRLQGDFYGAGLFAGRSWWLSDHFRLEALAGLAAGYAAYDKYSCDHCGPKVGEETKIGLVPQVALNIAYNPVAAPSEPPSPPLLPVRPTEPTRVEAPQLFEGHLAESLPVKSEGEKLATKLPWVLSMRDYQPIAEILPPQKDSAMFVFFELSSTELKRNYRSNAQTLDSIVNVAGRILRDTLSGIGVIQIVGLASIEGPEPNNVRLSDGRAAALKQYMQEKLGISDQHFEAVGKGEAWDWFRAQVADLPSRTQDLTEKDITGILHIIDTEPDPDRREALLKANGKVFQALIATLLADQRNSGYIRIYYEDLSPTASPQMQQINTLIQAGEYPQAISLYQGDAVRQNDPEALNAFALASYFQALRSGDESAEEAAVEKLREAAELGSGSAAANLREIETYRRERALYEQAEEERERYQEEMKRYEAAMELYQAEKAIYDSEYRLYNRRNKRKNY